MDFETLPGKYTWVDEIEAWTVSVMRHRPTDELVEIFGRGQAEPLGDIAFADVDRQRGPDTSAIELFLQIAQRGDISVTLENNGWSGTFPEIARRCSAADGWFFSVNWNVHAAGFVTQAIDGVVTARFESLYPLAPVVGEWERRPGWAIGPDVEPDLAWQVCMALFEQQTKVEVRPEWLTERRPTYRIPEPYSLYRDVEGADRV